MQKVESRKIRCPYCNEISEWQKNKCPLCGKFALMPGFHQGKGRKKRTYQRERKSSVSQPWLLNAGLWNVFGNLARLPKWVVWIGIVCVVGAYIQVSMYKFEQPEAVVKASDNIAVLNTALDYFCRDCRRYPTSAEGLAALVADPKAAGWKGPYIEKLKWDSWKRNFCYSSDGRTFDLFSLGPDGMQGTADDVRTSERYVPVKEENEVSVSVGDAKTMKESPVNSGQPEEENGISPR